MVSLSAEAHATVRGQGRRMPAASYRLATCCLVFPRIVCRSSASPPGATNAADSAGCETLPAVPSLLGTPHMHSLHRRKLPVRDAPGAVTAPRFLRKGRQTRTHGVGDPLLTRSDREAPPTHRPPYAAVDPSAITGPKLLCSLERNISLSR